MQLAVGELEQEFTGSIVARNVDATTPESEEIVKNLGFNNHGLVIRSPEGETLWSQPDHEVVVADVRAALEELTRRR